MYGYEVSPKAHKIALTHCEGHQQSVKFNLDENCSITDYFNDIKFDLIISTDVFGHVPDLPQAFKDLHSILNERGEIHAFSESTTGKYLFIANYLSERGVDLDESSDEHISLYSKVELEFFLREAGFAKTKSFGFDPIRFPFYPERYLTYLYKLKSVYYIAGLFFKLFSFGPLRKPTLVIYNYINYLLSLSIGRYMNTAGCFISSYK